MLPAPRYNNWDIVKPDRFMAATLHFDSGLSSKSKQKVNGKENEKLKETEREKGRKSHLQPSWNRWNIFFSFLASHFFSPCTPSTDLLPDSSFHPTEANVYPRRLPALTSGRRSPNRCPPVINATAEPIGSASSNKSVNKSHMHPPSIFSLRPP